MAKSIPQVKGMDWIVQKFDQQKMEPDEFTVKMVADKTGAGFNSVSKSLQRMRDSGELTCRKLTIKGAVTNVYKRASPVE
jgi:hypothetical protein